MFKSRYLEIEKVLTFCITSNGGNWESNYIKKTAEKLFVEDLITPVY